MKNKRLSSMLRVDIRRMAATSLFPIMLGISFVMPILILVMTSMVAGTTVANPQTGMETTMEAFTNTWQIIGSSGGMMQMDMTAMCNINLIYFMAGVFVCLFVAEDFRSGYAKNLFTVRAKKKDYVASKTIVGTIAGAFMLLAFFLGAVIGGGIAGLPFSLSAAGVFGLIMCMLAKLLLMGVFAAIAVAVSCYGKQRSWLSILLFAFAGMLLFMMIPMMTPLDATIMHVILCGAGAAMFGFGLGTVSNMLLSKRDLV